MMDLLLPLWLTVLHYAGWYVLIMVLVFSAAFAIVGVVVCVEEAWTWGVRLIRRWRVGQDLEREREHRVRVMALTGSRGVPRKVWEAGEPYDSSATSREGER